MDRKDYIAALEVELAKDREIGDEKRAADAEAELARVKGEDRKPEKAVKGDRRPKG